MDKLSHDAVSRRSFLKGSGAAAAASAVSTVSQAAAQSASAEETTTDVIAGETTITLNVNGDSKSVRVEPRTTLLDVLRNQLNLTGAKPVSGDGSSGASTVLIDGEPMMASTILALAARDKQIETIEALSGSSPDEVSQAFVAHDAQQCGFCTPGFVVAVRAFLNQNPQASEAEIRQSLNGNICRCGTYTNVQQAVISIVKGRS